MIHVDIVIPIYNAFDYTKACIEKVLLYTDLLNHTLVLINDKSSDERIAPYINEIGDKYPLLKIKIVHNTKNLGFVSTVNKGMSISENDVILLNSDTEVTPRWLDKIQNCAYSKKGVATVTPLSNNASFASVPIFLVNNNIPNTYNSIDEYADMVEQCSMNFAPEIPTGNGFCMYIRREALNIVGLFDDKTFGRGYGEENDFCYRCLQAGFRHLLCDNTYIFHKGTQSFEKEKLAILDQHLDILKKRYPMHTTNTHLFLEENPLAMIQNNINYGQELYKRPNILILIHTYEDTPTGCIGGTTLHVYDIVQYLNNEYNFHILHYQEDEQTYYVASHFKEHTITNQLGRCSSFSTINLYNDTFKEYINRCIIALNINMIHIHHLKNMYLDVFQVAKEHNIPLVFTLHDFYTECPSTNILNENKQPCYLYENKNCDLCLQKHFGDKEYSISLWQKEMHSCLSMADKIIAPSQSAKDICLSFYKNLQIDVIEHGYKQTNIKQFISPIDKKDSSYNIAFIGGITEIKGLEHLKNLVKITKGTDVNIHLFGSVRDTFYNVNSKNYIYHGEYEREQLPSLLAKYRIKLTCLLSIWPETFAYTLSEALITEIPVLVLNVGALGERVNKIGGGWVLPLNSSDEQIYSAIQNIKNNSIDYAHKLANIKEYLRNSKSCEQMALEYKSLYKSLIKTDPSLHQNATAGIKERIDFFNGLGFSFILNGQKTFNANIEYKRLKNLIIKGDAPLNVTIKEIKKFRKLAIGTRLRNKVVYKLIWYRFIQRALIKAAIFLRGKNK